VFFDTEMIRMFFPTSTQPETCPLQTLGLAHRIGNGLYPFC
jgi:hypothetical protein